MSTALQRQQKDLAEVATLELPEAVTHSLNAMERVVQDCKLSLADGGGKIARAFKMAQGIIALRQLITDQMMQQYVMPLMNTRLGFKTDRDPKRKVKDRQTGQWREVDPYPLATVKECAIEAMLHGANLIGNEFNIIASGSYLTKEFFIRAVRELDGVTDVVFSPGIPRAENGRTLIRCGLAWRKNGVHDCLKDAENKPGRIFEIKADEYFTADAIVGKATRKAFAAAFQQITGSEITLPEGDADDVVTVEPISATNGGSKQAEMLAKMKTEQNGKQDIESHDPPSVGAASDTIAGAASSTVHEPDKQKQQTGAPKYDESITDWGKYLAMMWQAAELFGSTRKDFDSAMKRFTVRLGKVGREDEIDPEERVKLARALKDKAGYFAYLAQNQKA